MQEPGARDALREQGVRGPGTFSEVAVENRTGVRAFVTVAGVANVRHPVHFREGGEYIEAPARGTRVLRNLPAGFDGSSALIVVLTGTPAGDVVRQLLTNVPPGAGEVGALLKGELLKLGYAGAAVEVVRLP